MAKNKEASVLFLSKLAIVLLLIILILLIFQIRAIQTQVDTLLEIVSTDTSLNLRR